MIGLGSGLLVGYGIGMLSRPAGFGTPGYGYNYYHRGRKPLKDSERLECVVANYTLYTKVESLKLVIFGGNIDLVLSQHRQLGIHSWGKSVNLHRC